MVGIPNRMRQERHSARTTIALLVVILTCMATWARPRGAAAATHYFYASFSGSQVSPPNSSTATGQASMVMDDVANTLSYTVSYAGLGGTRTLAHIHGPANPGTSGPVMFVIGGAGPATGTLSGMVTFSEAQEATIKNSLAYIDIHSTAFPAGEIRGRILPAGACCLPTGCALLSQQACLAGPGLYNGDDQPCGASMACCTPSGACTMTDATCCAANGGASGPPGSACLGDSNDDLMDDACVPPGDTPPCSACGPGPNWVQSPACPAGTDQMPTTAVVAIDTNLDCVPDATLNLSGPAIVHRMAALDDSVHFPGTRPIDGILDVVDTEILSMSLAGGGATLAVGAGMGHNGAISATYGNLAAQPGNPALADSFFAVNFEVGLDGSYLYNQSPLYVQSTITCVPPVASYVSFPSCIPLYTSPTPGQGVLVANLVSVTHDTYSQPIIACCFLDGSCSEFAGAAACEAVGGMSIGPGNLCGVDTNLNGFTDGCETDCNSNGIVDQVEVAAGSAQDLNSNGAPDDCDILECRSSDLNYNHIPDEIEIAEGSAADANTNGVIDEAEQSADKHSYVCMQGGNLRDDKLAKMLKTLLVNSNGTPNAKDAKLFFQECFGGGMFDDLQRELGTALPWVAGSAARHDEYSFGENDDPMNSNGPMDRWTRPLTGALHDLPVYRALKKAANDDVASPYNRVGQNERPQYRISGDDARGITLKDPSASSHHAVVLAGAPDAQRHRNDVRAMCEQLKTEWGNLNTNGTSVHVLYGDGTDNPCSDSGVPNSNSSAATTNGLATVLANLRSQLGPNEEFVLYISDHGDADAAAVNGFLRGGGIGSDLIVPMGYWVGLRRDPFNPGPAVHVIASGAYSPGTIEVSYNGVPIGFLNPAAINDTGQNETVLPLRENLVHPGLNHVFVNLAAAPGVVVVSTVLVLGGINTIPSPGWGDFDGDGDVDLFDYAAESGCLSGPGGGLQSNACAYLDIDGDGDVDLYDYSLFQKVFTGPL